MKMRSITIFITALFAINIAFGQWYNLGLNDKTITEIQVFEEYLFVGTNKGIYYKEFLTSDTNWTALGMQNSYVQDFEIKNLDTIIALKQARPHINSSDTISLFITYDAGNNWLDYHNNLPYCYAYTSTFRNIIKCYEDSDTLIISSYNKIWKSDNYGTDWINVLDYHWISALLYFEESNPTTIYFAGYSGFIPILYKSTDSGNSWNSYMINFDYAGDNYIYTLSIYPHDPNRLWAGMVADIGQSLDAGENWESININEGFETYSGIVTSKKNDSVIYASALFNFENNKQLYFLMSNDLGESGIWEKILYQESPDTIVCYSLDIFEVFGQDFLLFATDKGLYAYTEHILESKETKPVSNNTIVLFPNPAKDYLFFNLDNQGNSVLKIYNLNGKLICNQNFLVNHNNNNLDISDLDSGLYFISITAGNQSYTAKFIKTH